MRHVYYIALFLLIGLGTLKAQDYQTALGLRLGAPHSISLKHFIGNNSAIEVFAGYRYWSRRDSWFNLAGLYEHHIPIEGAPGLKWYVGGGAALLFWDYVDNSPPPGYSSITVSLLGALGLDYKFPKAPLNLSVDWVPIIFLGYVRPRFGGGYGAFSVRYTFN